MLFTIREFIERLELRSRKRIKALSDVLFIIIAYLLSYLLRFEWIVPREYYETIAISLPLLIGLSIFIYSLIGAYSGFWIYWSTRDLKRLVIAHSGVVFLGFCFTWLFHPFFIPRSIFIIYWFVGLMLLGGVRLFYRNLLEAQFSEKSERKRILIIGAGRCGEMLIRQIQTDRRLNYQVVGLIDDDPTKLHYAIHGVRVLGNHGELSKIIREKTAQEVIIATPSASSVQMRSIVRNCEKSGISFRTVPGPKELVNGDVTFNRIRKVRIEDLLGREQSSMDSVRVGELIRNRVILVTGAAGSIGSELCRQILDFRPKLLVAVDKDENRLFYLNNELRERDSFIGIVTNVRNQIKMEWIFKHYQPTVVFHAAAYKHVPSMEMNPDEAILNNLESTMVLAQISLKEKVNKFVQISTDKAVNPVNMMGVSKRLCELYCQRIARNGGKGFVSVRFGNVIGSQGSVVTILEDQIKNGQAITITHPEMERYFMSIDEACKLVLEAAAFGNGGDLFVLDMGSPIKIVDLARHMVLLSGLNPEKDIPIRYIGIRPGEKLREELWYPDEKPKKTRNPMIFVAERNEGFKNLQNGAFDTLLDLARNLKTGQMIQKIKESIPEYKAAKKGKTRRKISNSNKRKGKTRDKSIKRLLFEEVG